MFRTLFVSKNNRPLLATLIVTFLFGIILTGSVSAQEEGATAGEPVVLINQISSDSFPQVVVNVSVTDEYGVPLVSLADSQFLIFEDNGQVAPEKIKIETVPARELRLVLAFDLSTSAQSLADMKAAAIGLLNTIGPRDRVAIISFQDAVKVELDFTNNKNELQYIIGQLQPQGNQTRLNEAALGAVSMLNDFSSGRKGAILMTDRVDTGSSVTAEQVNASARLAGVPLFVVGFGGGVQQSTLESMTRLTGGRAEVMSSSAGLSAALQTVAILLRQSYNVTFLSGLVADNLEHQLSVGVDNQGSVSQPAEGQFLAKSNAIAATLVGFSDGDIVQGVVDLKVQVTASAPLASVEYFLNDKLLANVTKAPFNFIWDSGLYESGSYALAAKATDIAGNAGQTEVVVTVVPSVLIVNSTITPEEVTVGDQMEIVADLFPQSEVASVEFLLDGSVLKTDDTAPYSVSVNTRSYSAGTRLVSVQAAGKAGQVGEEIVEIEFLSPAPLTALGWRLGYDGDLAQDWPGIAIRAGQIFIGILLIMAIVLFTLILIKRISTALRRIKPRKNRLKIYNTGNSRSRYQLRAQEATGFLKLEFAATSGVQLQQPDVAFSADAGPISSDHSAYAPPGSAAAAPSFIAPPAAGAPTAAIPSAQREAAPPAPGQLDVSVPSVNVDGASKKAKGAAKFTQNIADVLESVGMMLPGAVGNSLLQASREMRQAGNTAGMVAAQPQQMGKAAESVQKKAGKVSAAVPQGMPQGMQPSAVGAIPGAGAAPVMAPAPSVPMQPPTVQMGMSGGVSTPAPSQVPSSPQQAGPQAGGSSGLFAGWVQTAFIDPGDSVDIDLIITPNQRDKSKDCIFEITSKSIEQEHLKPVVEQGKIHISAIPFIQRTILPFLISLLLITISFVLIVFIAYFITFVDITTWPAFSSIVG